MPEGLRVAALTALTLVAFASNSLLTRLALGRDEIDAASFTVLRLGSGALMLVMLVRAQAGTWRPLRPQGVVGPLALFAYAVPFSFAYLRIGAAVGALVLFGVVQLTMIGSALLQGERPAALAWAGIVLATFGLGFLTVPSMSRPDPVGLLLMTVAGVAWGVYSLAGRKATDPLAANARAFVWSSPLALLVLVATATSVTATPRGIALGLVSGALASSLAYAIWYRILPRLSVTRAAVSQLTVPVIAALGAVGLLGERLNARLLLSGAAVLSGLGLVLLARSRNA